MHELVGYMYPPEKLRMIHSVCWQDCALLSSDAVCAISSAIGKIGLISHEKEPFLSPIRGVWAAASLCTRTEVGFAPGGASEESACTSKWASRVH